MNRDPTLNKRLSRLAGHGIVFACDFKHPGRFVIYGHPTELTIALYLDHPASE